MSTLDQNDKIIKVSELKISSELLEVGKDGSDIAGYTEDSIH